MEMYGIESFNKKRNKRIIIIIIVLAIILIGIAIFGGIKLAEYMANQNQIGSQQDEKEQTLNVAVEDNKNNESDNKENESNNKNRNKLTKEQLKAIENIYEIKEKVAFLTFDDGPSSTVTPKILDTLKQENIKATFFVLGTMVKSNSDILKREQEEGHYIANHGYSHVYNKVYANENKPLEEYNKTNKLIQEALGDISYQTNVFRFPGGSVGRIL